MITVLIADDHPVVRSGLHALLSSLDGSMWWRWPLTGGRR